MTAATSHDRNFSLQGSTNETRTYWENWHLYWTCVEFFSRRYSLSNVVLWIVNNLDISKVFKVYRRCAGITYKCPGLGCRFCHLLHRSRMDTSQLTEWGARVYEHAGVLKEKSWRDTVFAAGCPHAHSVLWILGSSNVIPSLQQLMTKTPNQSYVRNAPWS